MQFVLLVGIMEKFLVIGCSKTYSNERFHLTLPSRKHFAVQAIRNGEQQCQVLDLISKAVNRDNFQSTHTKPFVGVKEPDIIQLPKTLQQILSRHPYPLSQGPVLLPVDCETENINSASEVLTEKTIFNHSDSQDCFEWIPVIVGVSAWGCYLSSQGC